MTDFTNAPYSYVGARMKADLDEAFAASVVAGEVTDDDIDSQDAPNGHVLKANGNGKAAWGEASGGRVLLETITNTSAGEFDFENISQDYNRLILMGTVRGDVASTVDSMRLFLNAELTETDYHTQRTGAFNGTGDTAEDDAPNIGTVPSANAPANSFGSVHIILEDYTGSNLKGFVSVFNGYQQNDYIWAGQNFSTSPVTAAVTRLRIRTNNHVGGDFLFGTMRLYAEE